MIPEVHRAALMQAFRKGEMHTFPGWFLVSQESTNVYLCKRFGLCTSWAEYPIGNAFVVAFNWVLQKWMVRT
jgi:hypothetical protein